MKKTLLTAILSIVMCMSLIAGATFALFTSESKVNIAITSGKVDVVASISDFKVRENGDADWRTTSGNPVQFDKAESDTRTAVIDGNKITLTNVSAGDGVKFVIDVANESTINVKYRTLVSYENDNGLFSELQVKIDNGLFNGLAVSDWAELTPSSDPANIDVEIVLPAESNAQGLSCEIIVAVEAIQGNASVIDPITKVKDGEYNINDEYGLALAASFVKNYNTGEGSPLVLNLTNDINMSGVAYTPIDCGWILLNGNNKTISNLTAGVSAYEKSGLFGYGGATTIKDLTLENVSVAGVQAGLIAGGGTEGTKVENVTIKGANSVKYVKDTYDEAAPGVGAIFGVTITPSAVDVTIADGATVVVDYNDMLITADLTIADKFSGLINALPDGSVKGNSAGVSTVGAYFNDVETITDIDELEEILRDAGASGAGNTYIEITEDLDMTGETWEPIKVDGYHGADIVYVDGNGATITGLTAPLFAGGFAGGSGIVIKNLTIADSNIVSIQPDTGSGAFIEYADSMARIELINCHLINSSVSGSRTGGLVGWTSGYNNTNDGPVKTYINIIDCSVIGCTITGSAVGGINGHAGANAWTFTTIENCIVKDCNLNSTDNGGWRVGVVVGTANSGEVIINNITESGNTLTQTGKTAPAGQSNLYGRFVPNSTGKLIIDGVAIA